MTETKPVHYGCAVVIVVIGIAAIVMAINSCWDRARTSWDEAGERVDREQAVAFADDGRQGQRRHIIDGLIEEGVFDRVEMRDGQTVLYVTDLFEALAIDDKRSFTEVVFAYHSIEQGRPVMVTIREHRNGKTIGSYMHPLGLSMQ